jgi:beta-fructofuranosidase
MTASASRYQPYDQYPAELLPSLKQKVAQSPFRQGYHIQPTTGLLNDPNGFSYFAGKWHLFYQTFPFGPTHGLKSWAHCISSDLVHWQHLILALIPDRPNDRHGVYSGSAVSLPDQLLLMYTGNNHTTNGKRQSTQLGALMTKTGQITKQSQPLLAQPPAGYTQEWRDPQIFQADGQYWCTIGGQRDADIGAVLLYQSADAQHWQFVGELKAAAHGDMIECPNLLPLDRAWVLVDCPQGLSQTTLPYQNIYPNCAQVFDDVDLPHAQLSGAHALTLLDEGFDVYATQLMQASDGQILAVSWLGLPETPTPSDPDGWANCLSVVKVLHIRDGHLIQQPIEALRQLRQGAGRQFEGSQSLRLTPKNAQYEFTCEFSADHDLNLTLASNADNQTTVHYCADHQQLTIDRQHSGLPLAEAFGTTRTFSLRTHDRHRLHFFVDTSSIELFCDQGEKVCSMRYFAKTDQPYITIQSDFTEDISGTLWNLCRASNVK